MISRKICFGRNFTNTIKQRMINEYHPRRKDSIFLAIARSILIILVPSREALSSHRGVV